jgi:hypothetical protein
VMTNSIPRSANLAAKVGLMLAWPILSVFLAAVVLLVMVPAWFLIPFGTLYKRANGSMSFTFQKKTEHD